MRRGCVIMHGIEGAGRKEVSATVLYFTCSRAQSIFAVKGRLD